MLNLNVFLKLKNARLPLGFVLLSLFLAFLISFNLYYTFFHPNPFTSAKIKMFSLSRGQSYYGRLQLWRLLVFSDNWDMAKNLDGKIDPADLEVLKNQFNPGTLTARLNQMAFLKNKTADDWLEMAKIYASLGNLSQSQTAIKRAYELDPIRSDIEKLYYSLASISLQNTTSKNP